MSKQHYVKYNTGDVLLSAFIGALVWVVGVDAFGQGAAVAAAADNHKQLHQA